MSLQGTINKVVCIAIGIIVFSYAAEAKARQTGMELPRVQPSKSYDSVRTQSGAECRQASGSSWNVEAGTILQDDYEDGYGWEESYEGSAVYVRMTYAIGAPKRVDCSRMYELELEVLRQELDMLRTAQQRREQ